MPKNAYPVIAVIQTIGVEVVFCRTLQLLFGVSKCSKAQEKRARNELCVVFINSRKELCVVFISSLFASLLRQQVHLSSLQRLV